MKMMNQKNNVIIDKRTNEDILFQLKEYAKAYTPEWELDFENPDIAAVLGYIFADQTAGNIERINQIIDRYHAEFVNLLDICIRPPRPAESIVVMGLSQDTIEGAEVYKNTRLLANTSDESLDAVPPIFETCDNTYITSAKIKTAFLTDREDGSVTPLLGKMEEPELFIKSSLNDIETDEAVDEIVEEVADATTTASTDSLTLDPDQVGEIPVSSIRPFVLFGEKDSITKNALLFYDTCLLEAKDDDLYVRIEGNDGLIDDICNNKRYFAYVTQAGLKPVETVSLLESGDTFKINLSEDNVPQKIEGTDYYELLIVDDGAILESEELTSVSFSAVGDSKKPDYVGDGNTDFDIASFLPFTENLNLYQECFIGQDRYFSKKGAHISLSFDMRMEDHYVALTLEQEQEELKIIKRKPKAILNSIPADVYANEITIEYYNGIGWKKLPIKEETTQLFDDNKYGRVFLNFACPEDWEQTETGSYMGRCLRIRLLRADNCYMRPAMHHVPRLSNVLVAYSYEEKYRNPELVYRVCGTSKTDITKKLNIKEGVEVFSNGGYLEDALYLGLDKRIQKGPASIFFELDESSRYKPIRCRFEYSSRDGFKPLKVLDGTESMSKSGLVTFIPPVDFFEKTVEKNRAFYIRIVRGVRQVSNDTQVLPRVKSILLNGIRVRNIDTNPEEDYFIDEIRPGTSFELSKEGILDADVYVNEVSELSLSAMQRMLMEQPQNVRAEYDISGNISAFYVKWEEVERFEEATHKRVYRLDRLLKEISFGDGIHTEIPRCLDGIAAKISVRVSNGLEGNVARGAITTSLGNLLYIGSIYNPVKGYGGNNIETVESAMIRGANIVSNRRRLVSLTDYIREISAYSDMIVSVAGIDGYDSSGNKKEGAMTFLLLMKDYAEGSYSFHQIEENLKKHLLKNCEMTLDENLLYIAEPVFVEISVIAWVKANHMEDSFEIQSRIEESLTSFISPLGEGARYRIGTLPTASQLQMRVNLFKREAVINNIAVLAKYTDSQGTHEMHINDVEITPFMIAIPGKNEIHIEI